MFSLATINDDGTTNMNILTYAVPVTKCVIPINDMLAHTAHALRNMQREHKNHSHADARVCSRERTCNTTLLENGNRGPRLNRDQYMPTELRGIGEKM